MQSIPEAQFQDKFYHASVTHTNGSVVSFPELMLKGSHRESMENGLIKGFSMTT
jgi:hypothetical protein